MPPVKQEWLAEGDQQDRKNDQEGSKQQGPYNQDQKSETQKQWEGDGCKDHGERMILALLGVVRSSAQVHRVSIGCTGEYNQQQ